MLFVTHDQFDLLFLVGNYVKSYYSLLVDELHSFELHELACALLVVKDGRLVAYLLLENLRENTYMLNELCFLYLLEPGCAFLVVVYDQHWIWFLEAADSQEVCFLHLVDGVLYICLA